MIPRSLLRGESLKSDAIKREKQLKQYKSAFGFLKRRIQQSFDKA